MKPIFVALTLAAATTAAGAQTPILQADTGSARIVRVHHEESGAMAPVQVLTTLPGETWAVSLWQQQNIYDTSDNKIGQVNDILMDHDGKPVAIMVGVGGFLGIGEKNVAVPFNAVHFKMKDQKWQLVMNANKDGLKSAPGYKYDQTAMKWMPQSDGGAGATVGGNPAPRER